MNTKCEMPYGEILDYFFGRPGRTAKMRSFEKHAKTCAKCGKKMQELAEIKAGMDAVKVDFSDEVWEKHFRGIKELLEKGTPA